MFSLHVLFSAAPMTIKVNPTFSKWYSSLRFQMSLEELRLLNKGQNQIKAKGMALFLTGCVLERCKTPANAVLS